MKKIEGPDQCYCFAARRNARYLTRLYDRHLSAVKLTVSQFTLLGVVAQAPGILVADLAQKMVMERTTLIRALRPLQLLGYIESVKESGSRTIRLTVTASGATKLSEAEPLWEAAQRERECEIGESEAIALRAALLAFDMGG